MEARVELLSSDHDTQVDRLRYALRGLLAENNQLRSLLGCMTAFIGTDMIGGPLQKAGMSRKELEFMINNSSEKSESDFWAIKCLVSFFLFSHRTLFQCTFYISHDRKLGKLARGTRV